MSSWYFLSWSASSCAFPSVPLCLTLQGAAVPVQGSGSCCQSLTLPHCHLQWGFALLKLTSTLSSGKGTPWVPLLHVEFTLCIQDPVQFASMACAYRIVNCLITSKMLASEGRRLLRYTNTGLLPRVSFLVVCWYSFCVCITLRSDSLLSHTRLCPWAKIKCYFQNVCCTHKAWHHREKKFASTDLNIGFHISYMTYHVNGFMHWNLFCSLVLTA